MSLLGILPDCFSETKNISDITVGLTVEVKHKLMRFLLDKK